MSEPFDVNKIILELTEIAETPDQVVWLKTIAPNVTQDRVDALRDLVKIAEDEAMKLRTEMRNMQHKYADYLSIAQVQAIIKAIMSSKSNKDDDDYY